MDERINEAESKTQQAEMLGVKLPEDGYWGNVSSRLCGMIGGATGGAITKEAVEEYEKKLRRRY